MNEIEELRPHFRVLLSWFRFPGQKEKAEFEIRRILNEIVFRETCRLMVCYRGMQALRETKGGE